MVCKNYYNYSFYNRLVKEDTIMTTKYDIIFEELQNRVNVGEISITEAEQLNDIAYAKYSGILVAESKDDDIELINNLLKKVEDGKVKLTEELRNAIADVVGDDDKDDDKDSDDDSDDD